MKDFEGEPKFLEFHAEAVEVTRDGRLMAGHTHSVGYDTDEEIKMAFCEKYDVDPGRVLLGEERDRAVRKGKIFGFGNWKGSKWEPAGPKGDPNQN